MTASTRSARTRVAFACALVLTLVGAPPLLRAQSTPTGGTLKEWDLFAATGGSGDSSQNVSAILIDVSGVAGPAGNVWVTTQNPLPRIGRLDPAAATGNYLEWKPVDPGDAGGPALGIALNKGNADIWMSMQGDPSFIMKLGGSNTFRRFRGSAPLVPHGIVVAADHGAVAALPSKNAVGIGNAIVKVPRNPASGKVSMTMWGVGGEPHHVALDSTGNAWFSARIGNSIGRLNLASGVVTEWALPAGTAPAGVQVSGSTGVRRLRRWHRRSDWPGALPEPCQQPGDPLRPQRG